jgi:LURP-one-related
VLQVNRQYGMSNVLLEDNTFSLTVYPNVDYAFLVAIIVILDENHKDIKGTSNTVDFNFDFSGTDE